MSEHYYTENPTSVIKEIHFHENMNGQELQFTSVSGVFSFESRIDKASALLVHAFSPSCQDIPLSPSILDMGCGYGAIGLCLKVLYPMSHVVMTDINNRATKYAKQNADDNHLHVEIIQGNLFEKLHGKTFTDIVSNPPMAAGKAVNLQLIQEAKFFLAEGGALWITAYHNKGGETLKKAMVKEFGNVIDVKKSGGIHVYKSCHIG